MCGEQLRGFVKERFPLVFLPSFGPVILSAYFYQERKRENTQMKDGEKGQTGKF